jgi:hypothetical protein
MKTYPTTSFWRALPLLALTLATLTLAACEAGTGMSDDERRRAEEQNYRDAWGSYRNQ